MAVNLTRITLRDTLNAYSFFSRGPHLAGIHTTVFHYCAPNCNQKSLPLYSLKLRLAGDDAVGSSSFLSIFSLFIVDCEICSVVFLNDSIKMDDGIWIEGKKGRASQREKIVSGWVISMMERTWICCYVCAFCLFAGWSGTVMLRGGDDEKMGFEKGHCFGCVGVYVWTKGDECKAVLPSSLFFLYLLWVVRYVVLCF